MPSVSSLIDFLMNLLRDEAAQAEFERDPEGTLAKYGLDGLCGQDVRDAYPLLADHPGVHTTSAAHDPVSRQHSGGDDDPVQAIKYITERHEVTEPVVHESHEYNLSYVDDRDTIVTVDDRDTTTINAEGDVTITDSFNQDNDVTVIEDSFNQDNDGVDNKNGTIDDGAVAGEDIEDSLNTDDSTTVSDSLNTDDDGTDIDLDEDTVLETQPA